MNAALWALGGFYAALLIGRGYDSGSYRVSAVCNLIAGVAMLPFDVIWNAPRIADTLIRRANFLVCAFITFKLKSPRVLAWWFSLYPRVLLQGDVYTATSEVQKWQDPNGPARKLSLRRAETRRLAIQLAEQAMAFADKNPDVPWHLVLVRVNEENPRVWVSC